MAKSRNRQRRVREASDFPNVNEYYSRARSLDWTGFFGWLPNPDPVLREFGWNAKVYEEILSDSHLTAVVSSRKSGTMSMLWQIDRGLAKSKHAKFAEAALRTQDIPRMIGEITDDFLYGYQPLEVIWNKPRNGEPVIPLQTVGKPPEWFQFDSENRLRFISGRAPSEGELIPPRKVLLSRHEARYKNPYGNALLSKVFWPITFKRGGFKFWVSFTEKYGSPFGVGKVPRGADETEYEKLGDILVNMVQDAVAVIPDDGSFEFIETGGRKNSDVFERMLRFCDEQTSKAILGQTLTTEAGDKGARSLGEVHFDVRADLIQEDKRRVEDCFNTLIRWIIDLNFGLQKEYPKFNLYKEEDVDKVLAERDKMLTDTGQIQLTQEYVDRAYGFEKGDVIVKEPPEELPEDAPAFAESRFKDQIAVDNLVNSLTMEELNRQADFVRPLLEFAEEISKKDLDDKEKWKQFQEGLIEKFPAARPSEVENALRDFLFTTEVFGNITGSEV